MHSDEARAFGCRTTSQPMHSDKLSDRLIACVMPAPGQHPPFRQCNTDCHRMVLMQTAPLAAVVQTTPHAVRNAPAPQPEMLLCEGHRSSQRCT
eukprot:6175748-Pleurochrysis_carterae.AAC.2